MSEFVASMFNFDSRFFQSFVKLLRPGTLTKEYISGKRKRYLNPARFFLFSMLFHFAVLAYVTKDANVEISNLSHDMTEYAAKTKLLKQYDSLVTAIPIDTSAALDSLRKSLFGGAIDQVADSLDLDGGGLISIQNDSSSQKYHVDDILNMGEDEFLDHYNIEGFSSRLLTKQLLRMSRDPQQLFAFFIGNLLWAVVLSIIFLSLILKLLYVRSKRFFVEHVILLMHIHSFVFILVGIALVIDMLTNNAIGVWLWSTAVVTFIYFYISMYRYYGQGFFKTLVKFLFLMLCYSIILSIFATVILLISLLVF